jgi:hypothetical protein
VQPWLRIRREKFAFFEKHCTKIVDGVYVAGEGVARNRATLDAHGITHVINCNAFIIPNYFEPDLVYKTLWWGGGAGKKMLMETQHNGRLLHQKRRCGGTKLTTPT